MLRFSLHYHGKRSHVWPRTEHIVFEAGVKKCYVFVALPTEKEPRSYLFRCASAQIRISSLTLFFSLTNPPELFSEFDGPRHRNPFLTYSNLWRCGKLEGQMGVGVGDGPRTNSHVWPRTEHTAFEAGGRKCCVFRCITMGKGAMCGRAQNTSFLKPE